MRREIVQRDEIVLVGISVRTSYEQEKTNESKISSCVQKYFHQAFAEKIKNRSNPGVTICAYTDYESDDKGDYTYFIGEQVSQIDGALEGGLESIVVPSQKYAKFTTQPGPMPNVVIDAWKAVWEMSPEDLGGQRVFTTDFELYDQRANDHSAVVLDLFIAIK